MRWPRRLPIDPFIAALFGTVALAALLPLRGTAAEVGRVAAALAVALLFFLHGAKIAPRAALDGARHWRLHVVVLLATFVLFPLLGLAAAPLRPAVLTPELYQGLLFLCAVPSTVQTSIAFTAIARGNVPAAVFTASFSNIAGIALTPLLVTLLLQGSGEVRVSAGSIGTVVLQLLVPFVAGQLSRRWTAGWIERHRALTGRVDRGAILLVVYSAFSAGVVAGVWDEVSPGRLAVLIAVVTGLLALVLGLLYAGGRALRFDRPDRVTILFCGAKKSLATGLPMAAVLVQPEALGLLVLPLMIYHQIQLVVCAAIARRWADRHPPTPADRV
ncbi:bile acid:sodium symporter family protein [Micromonospora sp. NPDC047793]|uniref:bile acid:sodium symporter family protein n=1 Tax=Micromonospora sp. NPDC047793 TaxID=3154342 RepID=UPI0033D2C5A6